MTPIRIVWAEDMDAADTDNLRDQVDFALQDPDFSIVANFEIHWEEMGSDQRLLDLSSELDITTRELYAGLGVTEAMLTGESSFTGSQISMEIVNQRYINLRDMLQTLVEKYFFEPMCRRMGFIEEDEDGYERVVFPHLSFTRLPVRDSQETGEQLFNLYQKGSIPVSVILEHLNVDPIAAKRELEQDMFTVNDSVFNEALRGIYQEAGRNLVENSDAVERIARSLGLKYQKPKEGGRF